MDTIENLLARAHKVVIDQKAAVARVATCSIALDKLSDKAAARGGASSRRRSPTAAPRNRRIP